jgi:hypothetical protein
MRSAVYNTHTHSAGESRRVNSKAGLHEKINFCLTTARTSPFLTRASQNHDPRISPTPSLRPERRSKVASVAAKEEYSGLRNSQWHKGGVEPDESADSTTSDTCDCPCRQQPRRNLSTPYSRNRPKSAFDTLETHHPRGREHGFSAEMVLTLILRSPSDDKKKEGALWSRHVSSPRLRLNYVHYCRKRIIRDLKRIASSGQNPPSRLNRTRLCQE